MLAVHGTEGIIDEGAVVTCEGDELVREGAAFGVGLGGLARVEAHVLQDQRFAVLQRSGQFLGRLADGVAGKGDLETGKLGQPGGCGLERVLLLRGALGAAQVCCDQHAGTGVRAASPALAGRP